MHLEFDFFLKDLKGFNSGLSTEYPKKSLLTLGLNLLIGIGNKA